MQKTCTAASVTNSIRSTLSSKKKTDETMTTGKFYPYNCRIRCVDCESTLRTSGGIEDLVAGAEGLRSLVTHKVAIANLLPLLDSGSHIYFSLHQDSIDVDWFAKHRHHALITIDESGRRDPEHQNAPIASAREQARAAALALVAFSDATEQALTLARSLAQAIADEPSSSASLRAQASALLADLEDLSAPL